MNKIMHMNFTKILQCIGIQLIKGKRAEFRLSSTTGCF